MKQSSSDSESIINELNESKNTSSDVCRKSVVCRLVDEFTGFRIDCDRSCCAGMVCLISEAMGTAGACMLDTGPTAAEYGPLVRIVELTVLMLRLVDGSGVRGAEYVGL